jgi:pimeloyl-ACP methyl ester carboxylesterase
VTAFQPLTLRTEDGVRLHGVHRTPLAGAVPGLALVLAHGFTGNTARAPVARLVDAFGAYAGVVAVDLRGHGRSGGRSTLGGAEVHDVTAAVEWARAAGYSRVATIGFSMGGSVVVRHAALVGGVEAVVAVSAPSRWYYRGTVPMRRVHWLVETRPGRVLARALFRIRLGPVWEEPPESPVQVAPRLAPTPLLVVHGDADAYFPLDHPRALAAAAGPTAELWEVPGFGHAEGAMTPELVARVGRWLAAHPARRSDTIGG